MVRVATFNLENLFSRPDAMMKESAAGKAAIEDHAKANAIIARSQYSDDDKKQLAKIIVKYKQHYSNPPESSLLKLNKIRGKLFRQPENKPLEIVAEGRASWIGWFYLSRTDVKWDATYNTGLVINETHPDILICVEVENRPTLQRFNEMVLAAHYPVAFPHVMVVDGNDVRGIDLGIMSRFPVGEIRSHVDDPSPKGGTLFSRDCPEYDIELPDGSRLIVVPNHLKSKRNSVKSNSDQTSEERRQQQATRVHEIATAALARSDYVLLAGDFNDTPDSPAMKEVLKGGFTDVMTHKNYPKDRPGTYDAGRAEQKFDYLIMSPKLKARLKDTGIERRGTYHPNLWKPFDTVKSAVDNASDHQLVWADFDLG